MLPFKRLSSVLVVIATVAITIASTPVQAQSSTPSATCDTSFGADAGTVFQGVSAATNGSNLKASDFAGVSVSLAKIRAEYEDMTAPAGCEQGRQELVKVAAFDEDAMLLNVMARLDTSATRYVDFLNTTWQPRLDAFKTSLAGTATPAVTAPASGSAVCADKTYLSQATTDLSSIQSLSAADPAGVGTALLGLLKLRYKYEDTAAPAGCELANGDMVKVLGNVEDSILGTMGAQADTVNAKMYTDFLNESVFPRGSKLYTMLAAELGIPVATPAATAAAS